MKPSFFFLENEAKLAFAAAVGTKLAAYVDGVEMRDENHRDQRWAVVKCHLLNEEYTALSDTALAWIVEGMVRDMLQKAFWGHMFEVQARIIFRSETAVEIGFIASVFD